MAHDNDYERSSPAAVNTRIMVAAVVVLFVVVLFILFLHIYARWFWRSARLRAAARGGSGGRAWSRRFGRRRRMRFTVEPGIAANGVVVPSKGLDKEVLESLPIFFYTKKDGEVVKEGDREEEEEEEILECAVCLSEFEENEAGRRLPKCGHVFHTECIDMWFSSHSTCPLCRTSVGLEASSDRDRDLERGEAAEAIAVEGGSSNGSQGEQLLREAAVSGLITGTNASPAVSSTGGTTAIAIQILQDEGAILLQEQSGPSSSSSGLKGQSSQQQHFPASVLFWGNRSYTNSNSATVGSSSAAASQQQQEQHETATTTVATAASYTPSPKKQRRELIIDVPRRSAANFSSACSSQLPSPNSAEGGGQRSPLGAHLRSIKRLLSRDSRRDTSPSPVGRDCCESSQYHSACHTPGSITPTSQC
ncbi:RING-H2 finger protein ATL3-like [Selaginella moellendorffii]|nr:RING-H2 finger protein ATL3-like [Selaginella moellendorffii]|eukprot:XP_024534392.1 RING-H2 finger protein ATL3-like [Selaginella moellendorffii]